MSSPVKLDGETFLLTHTTSNRFISLGQQRENRGIVHTLFLRMTPISNQFFAGDRHQLSGYCSYCFLYNNQRVLSGVLFISHSTKTLVSDFRVVIGDCLHELPDNMEPLFNLENCGILIFKGNDGSILLIPSEIDSNLLVKVD